MEVGLNRTGHGEGIWVGLGPRLSWVELEREKKLDLTWTRTKKGMGVELDQDGVVDGSWVRLKQRWNGYLV